MKLFIKRHSLELLNLSIVVILSIGLSYGLQWLVVRYSTITADSAHLLFALTLPIILLSLQYGLRKLMQRPELASGIDIVFPNTLDVNPETLKSVEGLANKLQDYFKRNYAINQLHFCVLDWKRKQYQSVFDLGTTNRLKYLLPANHALVYFVKHFQSVFTTERPSPLADELSDVMHAEMLVFMQKHKFAYMLPLFTTMDVYGFAFFRLDEIKDSKLLLTDPKEVSQAGQHYGGLLQQLLIYDAIVLQNRKKV